MVSGSYVPPHVKRRRLEEKSAASAAPEEDASEKERERQLENWDVLKKGINGTVNRVSVGNIKEMVAGLFR